MRIKLAICDDDPAQRAHIQSMAAAWALGAGHALALQIHPSAEAFLFDYEDDPALDILLLDIQMPGMDGIALAKRIRAQDERVQILFLTGYSDYMAEGYEVAAVHYLTKPIEEARLRAALDRAVQRLGKTGRILLIKLPGESLRIPTADILYAEAHSHHVLLATRSGAYRPAMRIGDMETLLGEGFFRCHRSYIVGMAHVRRVTRGELFLSDGQRIPLARGLYDAANEAFIAFVPGSMAED